MAKLLQNDERTLPLIAGNPSDKPPRLVRARLYEYRFTTRLSAEHGRMVEAELKASTSGRIARRSRHRDVLERQGGFRNLRR
jgi:hypothetical protein